MRDVASCKWAWQEALADCSDHHDLEALVNRNRHLFTPLDFKYFAAAGVGAWPRIFRLLRQEIRSSRGQECYSAVRGDPAAAAVRRVWRPSKILRK